MFGRNKHRRPHSAALHYRFVTCLVYCSRVTQALLMATRRKLLTRVRWTKGYDRALRAHSKRRTPVRSIAKEMKRTEGALRQRAFGLGIGLGHQR
jgi:hypothetical protein